MPHAFDMFEQPPQRSRSGALVTDRPTTAATNQIVVIKDLGLVNNPIPEDDMARAQALGHHLTQLAGTNKVHVVGGVHSSVLISAVADGAGPDSKVVQLGAIKTLDLGQRTSDELFRNQIRSLARANPSDVIAILCGNPNVPLEILHAIRAGRRWNFARFDAATFEMTTETGRPLGNAAWRGDMSKSLPTT